MTPQDLIRTILDAVAEDDLRKAEDAIEVYCNKYLTFVVSTPWKYVSGDTDGIVSFNQDRKKIYELFTQQNKP